MLNVKKAPRQDYIPCSVIRNTDIVELIAQMAGAWGVYEKMFHKGLNLTVFGRQNMQVMSSIYGTFSYLVCPDGLEIEIGKADAVPSEQKLFSLISAAYDIPFVVPDDVSSYDGFCIPDTIGATSRCMKYLDERKTEGRYSFEERKLARILNMLYFITDDVLNEIGYCKEDGIVLDPLKSERSARSIEQVKQSFSTIF